MPRSICLSLIDADNKSLVNNGMVGMSNWPVLKASTVTGDGPVRPGRAFGTHAAPPKIIWCIQLPASFFCLGRRLVTNRFCHGVANYARQSVPPCRVCNEKYRWVRGGLRACEPSQAAFCVYPSHARPNLRSASRAIAVIYCFLRACPVDRTKRRFASIDHRFTMRVQRPTRPNCLRCRSASSSELRAKNQTSFSETT